MQSGISPLLSLISLVGYMMIPSSHFRGMVPPTFHRDLSKKVDPGDTKPGLKMGTQPSLAFGCRVKFSLIYISSQIGIFNTCESLST